MPLQYGYCVVIGTLHHYERDPINDYGQYYHENLYLTGPEGQYHCAIDADTHATNDGNAIGDHFGQENDRDRARR
jgi:hypothetical protein